MANILASVSVVIGADLSDYNAKMAAAKAQLRGLVQLGESMKSVGDNMTRYVTTALGGLAAGALAASAKVDSLRRGLNAVTLQELNNQGVKGLDAVQQATVLTAQRLKELREVAKVPGLGFTEAVQGDIRLRAVGISADLSKKALIAFGNAIATTGGGKTELQSVTVQLAQLSAKGKVLAQDLRPIIEAAPAVASALQRLYGTVDSETISANLAKQGKSSKDFIATLTTELGKLPRISGGLKNAFENFTDTATIGLANFGDAINQAFNIEGLVDKISDFISRLSESFTNLSPSTQKIILMVGGLVAALGPLLVVVGSVLTALPVLSAGFAALTGPIGLTIAAVVAAAALIIANWENIVDYFSTGNGARVFTELSKSVSDAMEAISQAFDSLDPGSTFGDMISLGKIADAVMRDLATGISAISNIVAGVSNTVTGILNGDWSQAWKGARQVVLGVLEPLTNLLGLDTSALRDALGLVEVAPNGTGLSNYFASIQAGLPGVQAFTNAIAATQPVLASTDAQVKQSITTLESLKAKLKDLKESFEKMAVGTADFFATKKQIADLEALIKKYEDYDKAGRKAANAIANAFKSLRNDLRGIDTDVRIGIISPGIEETTAKIEKLENGLTKLARLGVTTANSAFRSFVQQMVDLRKSLNTATEPLEMNVVPQIKIPRTILDTLDVSVRNVLGKEFESRPIGVPIELSFQGVAGNEKLIGKALLDAQIELQKSFGNTSNLASAFANSLAGPVSVAEGHFNDLKQTIQNLIEQGVNPMSPAIQGMVTQLNGYFAQLQLEEFNQRLSDVLVTGIADIASAFGEGIGDILAGAGNLNNLGGIVLGAIGGLAVQVGQLAIATGIAVAGIKASLESLNPVLAIAGGVALVALGTAVKGAAKRLSTSGGGGGSFTPSAPSSFASPASTNRNNTSTPTLQPITKIDRIELVLRGRDASAMIELERDRLGRVTRMGGG